MPSIRRDSILAATVFAIVAALAGFGLMLWWGGTPEEWIWVWVAMVIAPAASAFAGGGISWRLIGRRPRWHVGAAAGLLSAIIGYHIYVIAAMLLFVLLREMHPLEPGMKEQGSVEFFALIGVMVSTVVFVPAAIIAGGLLGWKLSRREQISNC